MKKKWILILACILLIGGGVGGFLLLGGEQGAKLGNKKEAGKDMQFQTSEEQAMYELGKYEKESKSSKDDESNVVYASRVEKALQIERSINNTDTGETLEEAKERIVKSNMQSMALRLAAEDAGIEVEEEEVRISVEVTKEAIMQDDIEYKKILAYCKGLGISEDEYWNIIYETTERNLKGKKYLEQEYEKRQKREDEVYEKGSEEYLDRINKWKEEIAEMAIKKYNVTVKE